jgi:ADP-heptose:LPS heptosyltransferase
MLSDFHRLGEPLPRRIAIVRALRGLGDLLCLVPALRALRAGLPEAEVTLVSLPWARAFVGRFDRYLDAFVEFPGYPGIPERPAPVRELPAILAGIQAHDFDLALQMHGSGIASNPFTVMLGARLNAGFYLPSQYCPDPERFLSYPAQEPEVRRHLRLMEFLGVPLQGEHMEFPLRDEDRDELAKLPAACLLERTAYVCLHPGAYEPARRWPAERFAAVGDALAARGLQVVITGGANERDVAAAVAQTMSRPAIDVSGQTSLGALAALLSGAQLLVTNDTGVSHLAAALHVPSVVVFIASNPGRWAPLDRRRHRIVGRPGNPALAGEDGQELAGGAPGLLTLAPAERHPVGKERCLREGCLVADDLIGVLRPVEATPEMVLAEAEAMLAEDRPPEGRHAA